MCVCGRSSLFTGELSPDCGQVLEELKFNPDFSLPSANFKREVMMDVIQNDISTSSEMLLIEEQAWRTVEKIFGCQIFNINETSITTSWKSFDRVWNKEYVM